MVGVFGKSVTIMYNHVLRNILAPSKEVATNTFRYTSFYNKLSAEDIWRGVTSVSNAGKKRGRGKGSGKRVAKDLNRGQTIGVGSRNFVWPGLNAPIVRGKTLIQQERLSEVNNMDRNINKIRDLMGTYRIAKVNSIDRGWSGAKMPGRSIGPPDAINEEMFENFDTRVLENKIVFIMKGNMGRKRRYSVLSITGNKKGLAGFAVAKAPEVRTALRKSKNRAAQKVIKIELCDNHTVFHDFSCAFGKTRIFVQRKPEGYGLICHRAIETICKVIGIRNLHAKIEGSTNLQHIVKALFLGLLQQKTHEEISRKTNLHVIEFRNETGLHPHIISKPESCKASKDPLSKEVSDYTQYVLDDQISLKKRKFAPFYIDSKGYNLFLKRKEQVRNQQKVRVNMNAFDNDLQSV
ncbi:28S ribosomal protein S5, mitochondrial [Bactrocera dorsalis]|uniref:Small ribosomal subunit protein uS5m n=2 Tax=Bactrocera dorsalis TaxID=27457 RepID=A0ABM3JA12_BACDO|nr:28S ribosomal protein S5, mitochondrial [Bactrocera dorsalis]